MNNSDKCRQFTFCFPCTSREVFSKYCKHAWKYCCHTLRFRLLLTIEWRHEQVVGNQTSFAPPLCAISMKSSTPDGFWHLGEEGPHQWYSMAALQSWLPQNVSDSDITGLQAIFSITTADIPAGILERLETVGRVLENIQVSSGWRSASCTSRNSGQPLHVGSQTQPVAAIVNNLQETETMDWSPTEQLSEHDYGPAITHSDSPREDDSQDIIPHLHSEEFSDSDEDDASDEDDHIGDHNSAQHGAQESDISAEERLLRQSSHPRCFRIGTTELSMQAYDCINGKGMHARPTCCLLSCKVDQDSLYNALGTH